MDNILESQDRKKSDTETGGRLNILFLTARYPYPIIGGDRIKPFNILSHLAKKHNVTLVTNHHGGLPPKENADAIRNIGVELHSVPLDPVKSGMRAAFSTLGRLPLEIGFYTQKPFRDIVNKLTSERKFDVAFAFFMRTAEYLKNIDVKKILMAEDCRTLYQKRSYDESKSIKQKIVRYWEYMKLRKYEPDIVNYFDATTLVTYTDIDAMTLQNPKARYRLLTNGVDIYRYKPLENSTERKNLVFTGKLDLWANFLMLDNIIKNIFPALKKRFPGLKLQIVGAKPTNKIRSLASDDIELFFDVPDFTPYLQQARVFIHPHIGATGIQNKLLEAMSCGCPVVTTPTGIQGIDAVQGEHAFIGTSNQEIIEYSAQILADDELAENMSRKARELIVATHSWEKVFSDVDEIIDEVVKL
jgi:glycosyltransferase involved in cell wall biosynthesis